MVKMEPEGGLKRRRGDEGVRRAKQLFTLETAVRITLEVYRELTGRIAVPPR